MESACQTVATSNLTMSTKLFFFLQHSMVVVNLRNSGNKRENFCYYFCSTLFSNNKNLTTLSYVALYYTAQRNIVHENSLYVRAQNEV